MQQRADLFGRGRLRRYRKGATLMSEGDKGEWVAVIASGHLKVSCATSDGDEILLAIRGPGELLGEMSPLTGAPRSATVSALEPVDIVVVAAHEFLAFLEADPAVTLQLAKMVSGRLRDADRKRVEFGVLDTLDRVASRLVELTEGYGEASDRGVRIDLPLTQQELAGWIGGSREAVAKGLRVFRARGLIETGRSGIVVLDVEALRRRAT